MRALSPTHALAHACLNRALDMQNAIPDRLKLLYDLRLMSAHNEDADWRALCALAADKKIAGVCLRSLQDAVRDVGAVVPPSVAERLPVVVIARLLGVPEERIGKIETMENPIAAQ